MHREEKPNICINMCIHFPPLSSLSFIFLYSRLFLKPLSDGDVSSGRGDGAGAAAGAAGDVIRRCRLIGPR